MSPEQSPEYPRQPQIIELEPIIYNTFDGEAILERIAQELSILKIDVHHVAFTGFDGGTDIQTTLSKEHPTTYAITFEDWLKCVDTAVGNNPIGYMEGTDTPCIAVYDRTQLVDEHLFSNPGVIDQDSKHKHVSSATVQDALIGVFVFLQ